MPNFSLYSKHPVAHVSLRSGQPQDYRIKQNIYPQTYKNGSFLQWSFGGRILQRVCTLSATALYAINNTNVNLDLFELSIAVEAPFQRINSAIICICITVIQASQYITVLADMAKSRQFKTLIFSLPTATLLIASQILWIVKKKTQRSQRLYYDLIGLCQDHQNHC